MFYLSITPNRSGKTDTALFFSTRSLFSRRECIMGWLMMRRVGVAVSLILPRSRNAVRAPTRSETILLPQTPLKS